MRTRPDLVLLTAKFPFGNKSETFLEAEMEVLADRFRRIFVLPSHREQGIRPLPDNAELVEMPWLDPISRGRKVRALSSLPAVRTLVATLRRLSNWGPYFAARRMYLDLLSLNVLKSRMLQEFVRERGLRDAIFYDYWFENSTLALALLRQKSAVSLAVCRAHRFDLYDEDWGGLPVPFRDVKARGLDAIFPVSDFGKRYLVEKLPGEESRIRRAYLGVRRQSPLKRSKDEVPLVLSCGSLLPRKQTHLIPEVLAQVDRPLRWVHLGDGPERDRVQAAAAELPPEVAWKLPGHLDNQEVLHFFEENSVAVLLSLSLSEGLPVSMMEALSFGVPVVALDISGIPEIVTEETGVLLTPEASIGDAAAGLVEALDPTRFDEDRIRAFFLEHFEAQANYNAFADALIAFQ